MNKVIQDRKKAENISDIEKLRREFTEFRNEL